MKNLKPYQIESMVIAARVMRALRARAALEDAIEAGPKPTGDAADICVAAALGLIMAGSYALTLLALAGKI